MSDSDQQPPDDDSPEQRDQADQTKLFGDPHRLRSDIKMQEMVLRRGRMPTSHEDRLATVLKIRELLENAKREEVQLGAGRVMVMMEYLNQKDDAMAVKAGIDVTKPQPTQLTPTDTVVLMDQTIPLPDKDVI
jgi:hypothetical protein